MGWPIGTGEVVALTSSGAFASWSEMKCWAEGRESRRNYGQERRKYMSTARHVNMRQLFEAKSVENARRWSCNGEIWLAQYSL